MKKELIVRVHIKINGEYQRWDTLNKDKQKEIGVALNDRAFRALGYLPVAEKTA